MSERKYTLTKIAPGDYVFPSNDGQTIWRIALYTEGPSTGLDWSRDRDVWGVWRWCERVQQGGYIDTTDWNRWEFCEGLYETRSDAIDAALRLGSSW